MAKHDRNMIRLDQVEDFGQYAIASGASVRPGKGNYQLLQIRAKGPEWHAICANAQDVITTPPAIRELIARFKRGAPPLSAPAPTLAPVSAEQLGGITERSTKPGTDHYAADLRDDAAIRMMTALLLKCADPTALLPEHIQANAILAYRMSDALLVAGGHA